MRSSVHSLSLVLFQLVNKLGSRLETGMDLPQLLIFSGKTSLQSLATSYNEIITIRQVFMIQFYPGLKFIILP